MSIVTYRTHQHVPLSTVLRVLPNDLYRLVMETKEPIAKGTVFAEMVRRFGAPERYVRAPKKMAGMGVYGGIPDR
jgi:hypothetical protein